MCVCVCVCTCIHVALLTRKNINCSIEESLDRFTSVCEAAADLSIPVRG